MENSEIQKPQPTAEGLPVRRILLLVAGILGSIPSAWALSVNPHFEATVRIQEDRGHRVISTGPYRFVRHPGYLSVILTSVATPLLLSSLWAFVPGRYR